ncbi:hypothetical protein GWK47_007516 [Chionoecetes opilio]|uniref:Uncharacterized protein n=1 Tax=Chionoecetes opilio TaxID=41210 RepID=A0A8J4Y8J6_CHIOP|nr:hypothetical protein GWK47_007516 [Chionoecetes opilio]
MRGEPLSHLAHELESLVCRAYPKAPEEMVVVLARDHFVDALIDQRLQIYVKQAHPEDVQVALARALEFESFLRTSGDVTEPTFPRRAIRARRAQTKTPPRQRRASTDAFKGSCWGCGRTGHKRGPVWAGGNDAIVGRAAPSHLPALLLELWPAGPRNPRTADNQGPCNKRETRPGWVRGPRPSHHPTSPAWTKLPSRHTSSCPGGHCVSLKGPVKARIGVGSVEEELPVFVAAMEEPCLLGMDYLSQCEALVDFGSQMLNAAESVINPEVKHAALWTGNRVQCMLSREGQESDVTTPGGEQRQDGGVMSEQPGSGGAAVTGLPEYLEDLVRRSAVCLTEAQTPPGRAWLHTL